MLSTEELWKVIENFWCRYNNNNNNDRTYISKRMQGLIHRPHLATSDVQHVCKVHWAFLYVWRRLKEVWKVTSFWDDPGLCNEEMEKEGGKGEREKGGEKLTFQAFLEHKDGIQVWKRELFPRGLQIPAASSNIIVNYSHTHTHKQTKPEGIHHGDSVRVLFVHKTNPLQQHCYITWFPAIFTDISTCTYIKLSVKTY